MSEAKLAQSCFELHMTLAETEEERWEEGGSKLNVEQ